LPTSPRRPAVSFIKNVCGLELRPFQEEFLTELVREENGKRVYTAALWGLPRGNGKSEVAAAVALAMLTIDGRPHREDKNPALVVIAAGSREQAAIPFKAARRMIRESPALERHLHVLPGRKVITFPAQDGELHIISREAPLQHGLRPTAVIFDEVWNQPDRELWDAMVGGLVKVHDPLFLCISTAGWDPSSLLADLCQKGESGDDPRFLYRWHGLPRDSDLDYRDPKTWKTANPAMSCEKPFLAVDGIRDSLERMHEAEFRRWHLNQWTQSETLWLPAGVWANAVDAREVPEGSEVALGFSGTYTGTSAGLVGCTPEGFVFVVGHWDPPTGASPEWRVSRAEVSAAVAQAMEKWEVSGLAVNPSGWEQDMETWTEEYGSPPVIEWPVRKRQRFIDACGKFYAAVTTGTLSHDGNPALAKHLGNARAKTVGEENYITHASDGQPITLAQAAVLAFEQHATETEYLMRLSG
jgi:phage terminase large subunit-like protein